MGKLYKIAHLMHNILYTFPWDIYMHCNLICCKKLNSAGFRKICGKGAESTSNMGNCLGASQLNRPQKFQSQSSKKIDDGPRTGWIAYSFSMRNQ